MKTILNISEILTAILLVVFILLQRSGGGLSSVFGGSESTYHTKRGFEKGFLWATIILAIIFIGIAVFRIILE